MVCDGLLSHCSKLNRVRYSIMGFCLFLTLGNTSAANLDVNPNSLGCNIDGPDVFCTIQSAVDFAADNDTIYIAPGIYKEKLVLNNTPKRSLTFIGSGVDRTFIDGSSRAFLIQENATIQNLSIIDSNAAQDSMGAGIYVNDISGPNITVNLIDVVLRNNQAGMGGAIAINSGNVNLLRTSILNNTTNIQTTTVRTVDASSGSGIFVGVGSSLVAVDSIIAGNTSNIGNAVTIDPEVYTGGFGAGIYNLGTTTLVNTTISGNNALATDRYGSGITNGRLNAAATLNLYNVTVTGNNADFSGGGVYNVNGTVNTRNSIITGNTAIASAPDCGGNFNSLDYNIIGTITDCNGFIASPPDNNDLINTTLSLSPLPSFNNNDPFKDIPIFLTHAPATNSPAIDGVGINSCLEQNDNQLTNDQRGIPRPGTNSGTSFCDIGAYEMGEGILVFPPEQHITFEDQESSAVYIALASQPALDVLVSVSSSDIANEGVINTPSVTFTPNNWNTPQAVDISVTNDGLPDGDKIYSIDFSAANVPTRSISVLNIDTVIPAGLIVTPDNITIQEGGPGATVSVRLATPPAAGSVIDLSITNGQPNGEQRQDTFSTDTLQFTDADWDTLKPITVTAVDDTIIDGNVNYNIIVSVAGTTTDPAYLAVPDVLVNVNNLDNEVPTGTEGVTFLVGTSPITTDTSLITSEDGSQVTFTAQLNSAPTANVTLNLVSNRTDEGLILVGANQQQNVELIFTPQNWSTPQSVTVVGQDDIYADGGIIFSIRTEILDGDAAYLNINPIDIRFINTDNDTPGLIVTPTSGLVTSESGLTSASFQVSLSTPPVPSLQVALSATVMPPANQTALEGDVTLPPGQLIFDSTNYNQPQTVIVNGLDDCIADGDKIYNLNLGVNSATTTSAPYRNSNAQQSVSVTNLDNESFTPQIVISKTQLNTSENGVSDTFEVCLTTQPASQVSINMTIPPSGTNEGSFTIAPGTLDYQINFDQNNWSTPQTVTVFGLDDGVVDDDQTFVIEIANAISLDPDYANMGIPDVSVTNSDNDSESMGAGIIVSKVLLDTSENGASDSFTIQLATQPSNLVTVEITIMDETEGRFEELDFNNQYVFEKRYTFSTTTWNVPVVITIVGVDDSADDGDKTYLLQFNTAGSIDSVYNNLNSDTFPTVEVRNQDDDRTQPSDPSGGGNTHYLLLLMLALFQFYRKIRVY